MKILLICSPRSGSTTITKSLSKTLGISQISIPDVYRYPENKILIDNILKKENIILRMNPIHEVGYDLIEFTKFFDKVILLTRKNTEEHYKSWVNLYYKEMITNTSTTASYTYDEIPNELKVTLKTNKNWLNVLDGIDSIKRISDELNIPILYYEDVFKSNLDLTPLYGILDGLDLNGLLEGISQTKKYRISSKTKTII